MVEELEKLELLLAGQIDRERRLLEWVRAAQIIVKGDGREYRRHVSKFHDVVVTHQDAKRFADALDDHLVRLEALL